MELTSAVRFYQTGGTDLLTVEEVPLVEPSGNEVCVRVEALALDRANLLWRTGAYIADPHFLAGTGYDIPGVVQAVGRNIPRLRVGSRGSSFPSASLRVESDQCETAIYPEDGLIEYLPELSAKEVTAVHTTMLTVTRMWRHECRT